MEKKNIVDVCRSFEEHFGLSMYSVSIGFIVSLNHLNANDHVEYSPKEITLVRFILNGVSQETVVKFKAYTIDSAFVEIYELHKTSYGKEFVLTTWQEPRLIKDFAELMVPVQTKSVEHCDWLGKLSPCGGLNNNLNSMMNGMIFAYFTGMAYLAPDVPVRTEMCYALKPCASFNNQTSWFKKAKSFSYL